MTLGGGLGGGSVDHHGTSPGLRYLPTQLSFAVIADKLGISRSAAKERAERAYKKLGVHSRAEAVNRARDLGIID